MGNKHIAERLIETSKKISEISSQLENTPTFDRQKIIDDVNFVIRQLDELVEKLEQL